MTTATRVAAATAQAIARPISHQGINWAASSTTANDEQRLVQVFNTLKAYSGVQSFVHTTSSTATTATKDRLRMRLAELANHSEMLPLVTLLRWYFNTYRQSGWRITEWQVAAALRLLSTVAEEVAPTSDVWELEAERVAALGPNGDDTV